MKDSQQEKEKNYLNVLLDQEDIQIRKLNEIVAEAIREERLIVEKLANQADEDVKTGQRIADKVASFGGSWRFIISFIIILVAWIIVNTVVLLEKPFDPYPFILLNLILSCIAALQAPVIMMSQNRKEQKDRKRSENDYLINLKAEIEIRNLHSKLDMLIAEEMKNLFTVQRLQMEELEKIKSTLNDLNKK
ncbi:MAG TPA: DUF1003 domain-containing protein [Bacteroidia bacterium]|nr:DUF1003 domain-containing protein [Bacteroidia bacterium]